MHTETNEAKFGKIRVVLVGGSGYTGFEVIRCLARHGQAELVGIFGPEGELGPMESFYPHLAKLCPLEQVLYEPDKVASLGADLAMLCVPHKVAMSCVPALLEAGLRVIDWSADYRLRDPAEYEKWYCPHTDPEHLAEAAYGLPEYCAERIRTARLVANPGCYPTCTTLALAPVIAAGLIEPTGIVCNAISGVSGAGRTPSLKNHFPERNENFEPYGVGTHRHMPEMEQALSEITGRTVELLFQPHLCPMDRGMLCSLYARPAGNVTGEQLTECLQAAYADKPFVRVRTDVLPATKYTSHTNFCDVAARVAKGRVVLFSALDNLLKGASGQAVQNMNVMFGFDETAGLY
ncbi:MAG TPA: N-acetyl-gamma-glutamyl-phosphate reductase [Phycisphaerae bacterium]|nr:N-acetyl-gamma-glutamyl-phosphate reductase [Phycisphaerae bacterium]